MMMVSDQIIDIGPGAGVDGAKSSQNSGKPAGRVSLTGAYLSGRVHQSQKRRRAAGRFILEGARAVWSVDIRIGGILPW